MSWIEEYAKNFLAAITPIVIIILATMLTVFLTNRMPSLESTLKTIAMWGFIAMLAVIVVYVAGGVIAVIIWAVAGLVKLFKLRKRR
jgi:hypothetical protein